MAVADDVGQAVGRRRLGSELRRHRIAAGATMRQVAEHLHCSQGKISRLEAALVAPNVSDVRVMLDYYGVAGAERDDLVAIAGRVREKAWWNDFSDVVPPDSARFFGLEDGAGSISEYSVGLIPGLLQTEDYARALMLCAPGAGTADIQRRAELRRRRQEILRRADPPRLHVVMDQTVLQDTVGGPDAARGQLARLLEVAELPHVTVQVLGHGVGAHAGKSVRFSILRFPDPADADIVYLESPTNNTYLDEPTDLKFYETAFVQICRLALPATESIATIASAVEQLRKHPRE